MNWSQWLPSIILAVIAAGGGIVGTVWVKRLNRSVDRALARKSTSESKKAEAETVSLEVATARNLIEEIEKMMARQRLSYESRMGELSARHDRDLHEVNDRIRLLERRERELRDAWNMHAPWDALTVVRVRESDPTWPDPPPIRLSTGEPFNGLPRQATGEDVAPFESEPRDAPSV
ncbi:hypothetical protein [Micromonospora endolithica]|uniref:Uncharacterized protein n=1 Tax=Micromonospora endolithica TaxID=230091 RepID=A0A3A9YSL1_9ACTN|nr:hypothetical protein [Micromonospora endolithica]RKN38246.1 hypothetical protein D7223_31385 [Micromonospora endolithica]TWJ25201.1 hypothetical protein JD76_05364 [Micromonospora endolithica]